MNFIDKILLAYAQLRPPLKDRLLTKERDKAFIRLQRQVKILQRIDVKNWRNAHNCAIDITRPRRDELMEVYEDALLDLHLDSVIETRFLSVLNIPVEVYDKETGEADVEATKLIRKRWFYKATLLILESITYGYSLLRFFFKEGKDLTWEVEKVACFPREHVVPEWHAVLPDIHGEEKIFIDEPPYTQFYVLVDSDTLGKLLKCSRYTIFKKYSINHWSRYQDVFGIPPRTATTNSRDDALWDKLEQQLKEMGNSMSAILPDGTDFQVHEMTNSDPYNVFLKGAEYTDSQNSKAILGQTMTTDDGSSRSQSEVHERVKNEVNKADILMAEQVWNDDIFPLLISWGYPFEGMGLRLNKSSKLKLANSQLEIDQWISSMFEIEEDYVKETYGTPITGRKEAEPGKPTPPPI